MTTVDSNDDPDLPLLRAFATGDARASRQLVDRHLPRLHALLFRLLADRAEVEDIVQECFVKLWQAAADWQARARVSTWLYQVALNAARDHWRRQRPLDDVALERLTDAGPGPEQQAESRDRQRLLHRALGALPERQREAVLLCHYQQLGQREAAEVLQLSVGALESLLSRARESLRQQLLAQPTTHAESPR